MNRLHFDHLITQLYIIRIAEEHELNILISIEYLMIFYELGCYKQEKKM